jgi:hypothetical protein
VAHNIADLTLDEVIAGLIAGDALRISGGEEFSLPSADSRAILAFYSQDRRSYWSPDKDTAIQDGEIDRVLDALDKARKTTALALRRPCRNGGSSRSQRTASVGYTKTALRQC